MLTRSKTNLVASLPFRQMEGLGVRQGLEAPTAPGPRAALQGWPLTPVRLPKGCPCPLRPSGLSYGPCPPCTSSLGSQHFRGMSPFPGGISPGWDTGTETLVQKVLAAPSPAPRQSTSWLMLLLLRGVPRRIPRPWVPKMLLAHTEPMKDNSLPYIRLFLL